MDGLILSKKLFHLIHSLSPNEKGYFVRYAKSIKANNNYLTLYNAIEKLEGYNNEEFLKKIRRVTFLRNSKNLDTNQNYLRKTILKSLSLYHETNRVDIQMHRSLSEITVLEIKGLKNLCSQLIKAKKKNAYELEYYYMLPELLKKEAKLTAASSSKELLENTLEIYNEIFEVLKILEEEFTYRKLNHSILLCFRKDAWSAPNQFANLLKEISDNPIMADDYAPRSFHAKHLKENIRCIEAQIYEDHDIVLKKYEAIIDLWDSHTNIKKNDLNSYNIYISNYLGYCIKVKAFDKFENGITGLEKIYTQSGNKTRSKLPRQEKVELFQNLIYNKLLYFLNYKNTNGNDKLEEGVYYIKKHKEQLKEWENDFNPARAITTHYNIFLLYFIFGRFHYMHRMG